MKWNHLPIAGGIYDQNATLIEQWSIIFHEDAEHQSKEQEKRQREMEAKAKSKK